MKVLWIAEALHRMNLTEPYRCDSENYDDLDWQGDPANKPTREAVDAKIAELQAAEPLRQLRIERNQLLAQTDWRMTNDYPYADQSKWATYRTELRDLPATASPALDENGQLTNVDWPTAPSDL